MRYQSAEELCGDLTAFECAKQRRAAWRARLAIAVTTLLALVAVIMGIFSKRSITGAPNIVQRQITSNPVSDSVYSAAISGDGAELAYTDLRGIHIRTLDTGDVYDIPAPPGLCFR